MSLKPQSLVGLFLCACVLLPAERTYAQSSSGSVTGTVRDESGGILTGVPVKLVNESTNEQMAQVTQTSGNFTFPAVPPGLYRIEVEAPGFKRYVRGPIAVEVQQQVVVDPRLQIGGIADEVEVRAETPLVQPTTSSLGQVVPCATLPGAGSAPVAVSRSIGGLGAATYYYFRVSATNATAGVVGKTLKLKTPA